jgi:hypothetical protein
MSAKGGKRIVGFRVKKSMKQKRHLTYRHQQMSALEGRRQPFS